MYVSKFNFDVKSLGNNITKLEDLTDYPAQNNFDGSGGTLADVTNEAGRFLIVSDDGFTSNFQIKYYDNTIPVDPVAFELSLPSEKHDGLALIVPTWTQHDNEAIYFSSGDICVHDGLYYRYTGSMDGLSATPDVNGDWVPLTDYTESEIYGYVMDLINTSSDHIGWDFLAINYDCNKHLVYEMTCHNANVKIVETDNTEYLKVTISEYDNKVLDNWDDIIIGNSSHDTSIEFDFTVDKDQFYIIKVQKYDNTDTKIDDEINLLYHTYCDFIECYTDLIQSNYCCDCPDDPCDQYSLNRMNSGHLNLLRLQGLYMAVLQMVHMESMRYLNIYTMEDSRKTYVTKTQEYMEKINYIVGRCDDCNNATEDNPCNNC